MINNKNKIKLMNKGKILLICLAGLFAAACAKDNVDQPAVSAPEASIAKKFVNTSSDAVAGSLLVYVDKAAVAQLESANGSVYTGVSAIDNVAQQIGATSVKQLFNMKMNADLKRELGMDRWFTIQFPESVNVDDAAKALAATDVVKRVEFTKPIVAPNVDEPVVVELNGAVTRSGEFPNDEKFNMQWPLLNVGNPNKPTGVIEDEDGNVVETYYSPADYEVEGFIHPYIRAGYDINVVPAWKHTKGNRSVIVAVIDQGVDYMHPDLAANMWVNEGEIANDGIDNDGNGYVDDVYGYNFIDNPDVEGWGTHDGEVVVPVKPQSHGTHVAGTIAAVTNNGKGVAGIAGGSGEGDGVRIMTLQILGGDNTSSDQNAAVRAMEYAADMGAVISQNSWGNNPGVITSDSNYKVAQSARYAAFNYFMKKQNHPAVDGGIIVFAAGNESAPMAGYPGAYNEYIAVTALGPDGLPASYTNYGPGCNIAAPGGEYYSNQFSHAKETGCVLSTLPCERDASGNITNGEVYGYMQGTSMATPHVSGVAALALSYAEDLGKSYTTDQFKEIILTSVQDINAYLLDGWVKYDSNGYEMQLAPYRNKMGTGLIDAYRALAAIRGMVCVPAVAGEENVVNIKSLIADGNTSINTLEEIIIPNNVRERLGIKNETIFGDDLIFECENTGTGVIKIVLIGGGDQIGGGNSMGGMRLEKEIAIISRAGYTMDPNDGTIDGTNGWL